MAVFLFFLAMLAAALGALVMFAGSMSDAPEVGDAYGRNGCILVVGGLVAAAAVVLVAVL
jgi:hypothetical protein